MCRPSPEGLVDEAAFGISQPSRSYMILVIHGIEYNASAGMDISLRDVRPESYQHIMQGCRTFLNIWRQQKFMPICAATWPCCMEVVVLEVFSSCGLYQICAQSTRSAISSPTISHGVSPAAPSDAHRPGCSMPAGKWTAGEARICGTAAALVLDCYPQIATTISLLTSLLCGTTHSCVHPLCPSPPNRFVSVYPPV